MIYVQNETRVTLKGREAAGILRLKLRRRHQSSAVILPGSLYVMEMKGGMHGLALRFVVHQAECDANTIRTEAAAEHGDCAC
jgi:hypothetical protein